MNLSEYRTEMDKMLFDYKSARGNYKQERRRLIESRSNLEASKEAQGIIQSVAQKIQQQAHKRIESVVTKCIQSVFDDPYEFRLRFEQKRGKTEACLSFYRDGEDVNPLDASGGGVVDIASFALRMCSLIMSKPPLLPIVVSDEPFRFVSEEYWERVRELIETISKEMKVQIVMVTHNNELKTGKQFEMRRKEK